MPASTRQSELFAGNDWTVLYKAFTDINFNASDPPTIAAALRTYIQNNYPEDFNDWIERSEFVAIIDLLAWLAGSLAFKTDIAVRENFLEVAEAKESILRLARFLSYNPSRNQCSSGIIKLVGVQTNDDVYDSDGENLNGVNITWNNPDDSSWYERFITVLNSAFVSSNPYGIPLKSGTVSSIDMQTYRFNSLMSENTFKFTSTVASQSMTFELCNGDFTDGANIFEKTPNPSNAFQLYYLNDGNGYSSSRTGFFFLFKQGTTRTSSFYIDTASENQTLDITDTNINNTDVWIQTVDTSGNILIDWNQIPVMLDQNITYNTLAVDKRNIFSIITKDNDAVTIRFSDGRFGNAPTGNIKVTYRVSNGLSYTIRSQDISDIQLPLKYYNSTGVQKTLYLTFSLEETVSNSVVSETIDQIKTRAPMVYATQNRMVSGEDYNSFPLQTNLAVKLHALNRVYSGQSRYINLNDPTGTYQDLSIFADDGILFKEVRDSYQEIPTSLNRTVSEIMEEYIQPALQTTNIINAIRDVYIQAINDGNITISNLYWGQTNNSLYSSTGWFNEANSLIQVGSIILFKINSKTYKWVAVSDISGDDITYVPTNGAAGAVTLAESVPGGSSVVSIIPSYVSTLDSTTISSVETKLTNNLSFSLIYDYSDGGSWLIGSPVSDIEPLVLNGTQLTLLSCNYMSSVWQISSIGIRYVFESINSIQWFDDGSRAVDSDTGQAVNDTIRVLKINEDLNNSYGKSLSQYYDFTIDKIWLYMNSNPEPRRTTITFSDSDSDGYSDNPDSFYKIINNTDTTCQHLFWNVDENTSDTTYSFDQPYYDMVVFETEQDRINTIPITNMGTWSANNNSPTIVNGVGVTGDYYTVGYPGNSNIDGENSWSTGDIIVFNGYRWVKGFPSTGTTTVFQLKDSTGTITNTFWYYYNGTWTQDYYNEYRHEIGRGPNVAARWINSTGTTFPSGDEISLQWKHYSISTNRIDPAKQNINDIYVLTTAYDNSVRQWINDGAILSDMPTAPTELDLRLAFESMEDYKMFSDAIVWRPVSYKMLFGNGASDELKMTFKVVRLSNATLSDGEIKSKVISAINSYFAVNLWDFGETFYWSELSAYIHQNLANIIGSIALVPLASDASFGDGFEVTCLPNQIFISTAQVSDVTIITSNTASNLRIK